MNLNDIIVFFTSILFFLVVHIIFFIIGHDTDCYFSDKTIKKLTIPEKSILRKLILFKESKKAYPPLSYIWVIPYLIQLLFVIIATTLFFINQFVVSFIPSNTFLIIGYCDFGLNVIYVIIIRFLSQGLRL